VNDVVSRPKIMRQYELVERVKSYNPDADEGLLNRAYVYAMMAHGGQKRASGDLFFSHPLEVAAILTDLKLDDATIVAAVLHDTVEDTDATLDEITKQFGPQIGEIVDGLTKIKKLDLVSRQASQGENFRKLLLAISKDVRVLLVKLADRLHNMRTLRYMPSEKRKRISEETLEIYAPLAGRMGIHEMRDEMEELSFQYINPEMYVAIVQKLEELTPKNVKIVDTIVEDLKRRLNEKGIPATVTGRQKRPYSIWNKMQSRSVSFEQLSDIFGFRILVDTVEDCYRALGLVHTTWRTVPGRFKDYISTPKQNDYQSIHTTVIGAGRQRVELQIRTRLMHEIAERGIAAHALYKEGKTTPGDALETESRAYQWLRATVDLLAEGDSPDEFLEHTKLELFQDQVFCFTPRGGLIALPKGATPIDFAYALHTDIGNTAIGCKINGNISPLAQELMNGDEVEIVRAEGHTPPAVWETLAVTGKARAAIRRATRAAAREKYAHFGREILERAFARAERSFDNDKLKAALPRLARADVEEALAAVGLGEISSSDVIRAVYPDFKAAAVQGARVMKGDYLDAVSEGGDAAAPALPISGINPDLPVHFAPEGVVPGDRIVGIVTPGEGVTIYPIQSSALAQFDDETERWIDVRWDLDTDERYRFPARIQVKSINEPGALAQIAQVIADHDGNIDNVRMERKSPEFTSTTIDLAVWDLTHLNAILSELRTKRIVNSAVRLIG
jgi:GTP pyrophosphokinase